MNGQFKTFWILILIDQSEKGLPKDIQIIYISIPPLAILRVCEAVDVELGEIFINC